MAIAQGQFTIIDYNDAITLMGYISSNKPKTQVYTPDSGTSNPDWSRSPYLVLTASLFVAGSGTGQDVIDTAAVTDLNWYKGADSAPLITEAGKRTVSGKTLTILENLSAAEPSVEYRCRLHYTDATTGLTLPYEMSITLNRVVNGGGLVALVVTTPDGNIFRNGAGTLTARAELWRGSTVDDTLVSYQWYQQDSSAPDQGAGEGWKKLAGQTDRTLTVSASDVGGAEVFKCVATDADTSPTNPTSGQTFSDTASFVDMTDPYSVIVSSDGGSVFKNGNGNATLTAHLYQSGAEIDTGATPQFTYTWSRYQENSRGENVRLAFADGSEVKTGKTLAVGGADVDVKATFIVEVTKS